MKDGLLLVVDIQNGFINKNTEHVVQPIAGLAAKWLQAGAPVIYSRFVNLEDSPWVRFIGWNKLTREPETLLDKRLPIKGAQVFKKSAYSAWSSDTAQLAAGAAAKNIYICGVDTDQCVLSTALDVFEANFRPLVIKDLCASSEGNDYHNASLFLLERLIGVDQMIDSGQIK